MATTIPFSLASSSLRKKHLPTLAFLAVVSIWFGAPSARGGQQGFVFELVSGSAVERAISGGEVHSYQITLSAGDYLRATVRSPGIDLKFELMAPDGATRIGGQPVNRSTIISRILETSGLYKLFLRTGAEKSIASRYELKIDQLRSATEQDRLRVAAEQAEWGGTQDADTAPEQWQQSIEKLEEALKLWKQIGDRHGQLRVLTRLGEQYVNTGEPQKALTYFDEAAPLAQSLEDRYQEGLLSLGFGNAYYRLSRSQRALDSYNRARETFASLAQPLEEAIAIERIGLTYSALNDNAKSLEYLRQALQTFFSLRDVRHQCSTLNGIGVTYNRMRQRQQEREALDQSLAIAREHGLTGCEGRTLRHLGFDYFNIGNKEKATESFNEGLRLCNAVGDRVCEATALRGLGAVSLLSGDRQKALDYLDQALTKFHLAGERSREAITLDRMAQINQSLGKLAEARQQAERSLDIMESMRADVVSQDLRGSFFVSAQSTFGTYIDVLMQLHQQQPAEGYDAMALKANERARARGLLELLAEARADIRKGVPTDLLEIERSLRDKINAKAAARARLDIKATEAQYLDKELSELTSRYRDIEAQVRAASPRYVSLTQPQPLSSSEIQELLDDDTVLLEFALGEKTSWLWAVTKKSLSSYKMPPRAEIEAASRKVYELLTARQPNKDLTESEQEDLVARADLTFQTEAATLSKMLFDQVAPRLRSEWQSKRLAIVASGGLEYVPFAALPLAAGGDAQPLIADHELISLPSASVLAVIRREPSVRQDSTKTLAVLADPVFAVADPRLAVSAKKKTYGTKVSSVRSQDVPAALTAINSDLIQSMRSFDSSNLRGGFARLPFSGEEADAIAALVPKGSLLKATGFRANRLMAVGGELSRYRIIHFATHGLLNGEHPELSGLVLSLVGENGRPQDGFLRMPDIYNLHLTADVVVLSACQSALGKEIKGEGLIGLTRGFMYAGARRVVASLWQVDDLATATLMEHLYNGMLRDGMRPAAALRAAQLQMMKQKRWSSPFFWAPFVIQGEWK